MTRREATPQRQREFGWEQNPFHTFNQQAFSFVIYSFNHSFLLFICYLFSFTLFFWNTEIPTKSCFYFSASIFIFCCHFLFFLKIALFLWHFHCCLISYFLFLDFKLIYFMLFFCSLIHIKMAFRLYESNGEEKNLVFDFFSVF